MQGEEWSARPDGGPEGLEKAETEHEAEEAPIVLVQEVICSPATTPFLVPATSYSSLNGEEPFCRICHEGLSAGELLSPCECAGTLAMVHRVCLERWLTASGTRHCELCHFEFALEHLPKPFTEWLATPSMQRRTLCGDVICFLFITPLASLSGWLCIQGALDLYYINRMEAFGLLMLTLALFTIYLFWTVVSLRYHIQLFKSWRETNPTVRLQIPRPEQTPQRQPNLALHCLFKDKGKETVV